MTHPALINALRQRAKEQAEAIWQGARAEAEECNIEAERAIEEQRARAAREMEAIAQQFANAATLEATREAREVWAAAKSALADRLYQLARTALRRCRKERYERLFAALAEELPHRRWQHVRVNPADERLARTHFPDTHVVTDQNIVGGLEVEAESGRIRISNTLEKRLQRVWSAVLPDLMTSILQELSVHRPCT